VGGDDMAARGARRAFRWQTHRMRSAKTPGRL